MLDPEVRLTVDGPDGVVVVLGATKVAAGAATLGREVLVNGLPGIVSWSEDRVPLSVMAFTVTEDRITGITVLTDSTKLKQTGIF